MLLADDFAEIFGAQPLGQGWVRSGLGDKGVRCAAVGSAAWL
jgi:hypothetical protein